MNSDRKARGYDRNLYRDPDNGWLLGICAGVAQAYEKPVWLVRIAMLTLFLFSGSLAVVIYFGAYFLLEKRPVYVPPAQAHPHLFDYSESVSTRARRVREKLDEIDIRLQSIERYVTSNRFKVNEEFRRL